MCRRPRPSLPQLNKGTLTTLALRLLVIDRIYFVVKTFSSAVRDCLESLDRDIPLHGTRVLVAPFFRHFDVEVVLEDVVLQGVLDFGNLMFVVERLLLQVVYDPL